MSVVSQLKKIKSGRPVPALGRGWGTGEQPPGCDRWDWPHQNWGMLAPTPNCRAALCGVAPPGKQSLPAVSSGALCLAGPWGRQRPHNPTPEAWPPQSRAVTPGSHGTISAFQGPWGASRLDEAEAGGQRSCLQGHPWGGARTAWKRADSTSQQMPTCPPPTAPAGEPQQPGQGRGQSCRGLRVSGVWPGALQALAWAPQFTEHGCYLGTEGRQPPGSWTPGSSGRDPTWSPVGLLDA